MLHIMKSDTVAVTMAFLVEMVPKDSIDAHELLL